MAATQAFGEGLMGDVRLLRQLLETDLSGDLEVSILARLGEGLVLDGSQPTLGLLIRGRRADTINLEGQIEPLPALTGLTQGLTIGIEEID